MCIFSQRVRHVSKTRIFARCVAGRQYLAYEMRLASETDVAMILPLPTAARTGNQIAFIDLSDYGHFFDDLERCFPRPLTRSMGSVAAAGGAPLAVHRVGAFDASFVPQMAEFHRLDPRFRLPDDVWIDFPTYGDFGFAVFQLRAGEARVHPMAFSFATRLVDAVFFPTTHVHDRAVHPTAEFDHALYAQGVAADAAWVRGAVLPGEVMDFGNILVADRTRGVVGKGAIVMRRELRGVHENRDVVVKEAVEA